MLGKTGGEVASSESLSVARHPDKGSGDLLPHRKGEGAGSRRDGVREYTGWPRRTPHTEPALPVSPLREGFSHWTP